MDKYYDAGDIDLDEEEVYTQSGKRLTEALAQEMAEDALNRVKGGRPSLSGQGTQSPQVSFRVPEQLSKSAADLAEAEGKTLSQLGRDALEEYVHTRQDQS